MSDQKKQILMIDDGAGRKIKKIVLDEDSFVSQLDKIVERDYFPDLKKLKTNPQLFNQLPETTPADQTPATLDKQPNQNKIDENASLGQFLSKYTSEDNASFSEIIQATNKRHQEKYPWFYLDEEEIRLQIEDSLKLPAIDEPQSKQTGNVITWPYRNKNSMMFNPDGRPISVQDQIEESAKNKQQIVIENTRFRKRPRRRLAYKMDTNQTEGSTTTEGSESTAGGRSFVQSKYDANGELVNLERKEYKLVESTPLIEPSDMASPLMTWGEVESTPLLIDSEEFEQAPSSGRFKIPAMSAREQVALKLSDSLSKSKKQQSNSQSSRKWNSSPFCNSPRTPRLDQMSPAVQQFAQSRLNLRLNIKNDYKNISSSFLHNKTPSPYVRSLSNLSNVRSSEKRSAPNEFEETADSDSTLTDNLLKLSSKDD